MLVPVLSILCNIPQVSELLNHHSTKFCTVFLIKYSTVQYLLCIIIEPLLIQCNKANPGQVGMLRTKQQALQQMAVSVSQPTEAVKFAKRKEYGP